MALISCPECLHKISEWALWCPKCGVNRDAFAAHVIKITPDFLNDSYKEERLARGYRIDTSAYIPQVKTLFTPSGERVEAEYYDDTLMIIQGEKVLGSIIGKELKEQDPSLEPSKYEGIEIVSRMLPDHGIGNIVRPYLTDKGVMVLVCFPHSKMLNSKTMQTAWIIDAFNETNLYSPQVSNEELKALLIEDAKLNYPNIELSEFLKQKAEERIKFLSQKLNRKIYKGQCRSCGKDISSADNQICTYCGTSYVCSRCGYCPTCHINPKDDPFYREMRLRKRLTKSEWETQCEEQAEDADREIDWPDISDIKGMLGECHEPDIDIIDDIGPAEEEYEYYHGDDEVVDPMDTF